MTRAEENELKRRYFDLLSRAWDTGDAEELKQCFAEGCCGSRFDGINVSYKHRNVPVMLEPMPAPLRCTDENGRRIGLSLWYESGEVCMYDETEHNRLLFRMELDGAGKIVKLYATAPYLFAFHPIPRLGPSAGEDGAERARP